MNAHDNMKKYYLMIGLFLLCFPLNSCSAQQKSTDKIVLGAEQIDKYLPLLQNKKVGLLVNHTSYVNQTHLVDTLLSLGIRVEKIFAPEHGFRGNQGNGELVKDDRDEKTGLRVISLYGKNKKASPEQLAGLDAVIYDIQDVGARFYTYISSMHYMMEACAENDVQFIILDRPNPNGHYVDGPVLQPGFESFVGMHPIPIVYGMTAGELAQMILGEQWLSTKKTLNIEIIPLQNWTHDLGYSLPIAPSPNLPNDQAINLYPSLCLFEGTKISLGRGTPDPFQVYGYPGDSSLGTFSFQPVSMPGYSLHPPHENSICYGTDLRSAPRLTSINLSYLIDMYQKTPEGFFNSFFSKLAGNNQLEEQIKAGQTESEIKQSWAKELDDFKTKRLNYLLYP
ncbi:DUF1343 domain-containing protein [Reichenbachiella agarivorans]|uniref:DUF1343 domain-containing protein n=1 Tax=Reichenbachiella agarivorans TaxID=2979464 RepID=A0ABY6CLH9_9BACT|nr:DUF1343 domain-containing protein [Reichenbachiella agarivorans]UXP31368.1 DUF1343 domain-containing protein [Reichenbachiella agarivorans]